LAWQCSCRDYDEGVGTALVLFTVTRFDRIPFHPRPAVSHGPVRAFALFRFTPASKFPLCVVK